MYMFLKDFILAEVLPSKEMYRFINMLVVEKWQITKQAGLAQSFPMWDLYSQLNSHLLGNEHQTMENVRT